MSVTDNDTIEVSDILEQLEMLLVVTVVRQRAKVYDPDQTVAISGLPNSGIKEISAVTTEVVRREFLQSTSGSGAVTLTTSSGTFVSFNEDDYHVSRSS